MREKGFILVKSYTRKGRYAENVQIFHHVTIRQKPFVSLMYNVAGTDTVLPTLPRGVIILSQACCY